MTGLDLNRQNHPGYLSVIPDGATGEISIKLVHRHKVKKMQFDITKACDDALKQKVLVALHDYNVEGVANENVGFAETTTLKLLNHM